MTNQQPPDIIEIGGVKYQRVEEPKPPTLYKTLLQKTEYYPKVCGEICDVVEDWLPLEGCHELKSYGYSAGWNDCIKVIRRKLR